MTEQDRAREDDHQSNTHPSLERPTSLSAALIPELPSAAYYIPAFITPAEEAILLHHINSAPLPAWKALSHRRLQAYPSVLSSTNTLLAAPLPSWLAEPIVSRLLALSVGFEPARKGHEVVTSEVKARGEELQNVFSGSAHGRPNHCLVNEYLPGQGIHPHEDGGAYWPVVCTVSLGSHTVLEVTTKRSTDSDTRTSGERLQQWRILQEARSLLVSTGEVYTGCLHGIEAVELDDALGPGDIVNWGLIGNKEGFVGGTRERETRISLTFRDVLKVKTLGKAFGGLNRWERRPKGRSV